MKRADALQISSRFISLISGSCDHVEVAGSLRRRLMNVTDIELVVIPKIEQEPADLYCFQMHDVNLLEDRLEALLKEGTIEKHLDVNDRPHWGPKSKRIRFEGEKIDLFAVLPPAEFGAILAIRTGPADYSRRLVTARRARGLMPDHLAMRDGRLVDTGGRTIFTPTEQSFFDALGLTYVAPEDRDSVLGAMTYQEA